MTLRNSDKVRPSITFDFRNSKKLDPRVTFTRASFAPASDPSSGSGVAGGSYNMFNVNVPRLTDQGLLIEEASTNRWTNSQVFSSGWTPKDMGTPTDNAAIAPDGTNTAASVFETATTDTHYIVSSQIVPSASAALSWSVFVKANGRDYVILHILQRFNIAGFYTACVDLTTGEITKEVDSTNAGGVHFSDFTSKVTPCGNGWYRIEVGFRTQNNNGIQAYIYGATNPNPTIVSGGYPTDTYAGDATKGYYLWGFQAEDSAYPTSYIPTAGQEVTRAADLCEVTGDNFSSWYNQNEWTVTNSFNVFGSSNNQLHGATFFGGGGDAVLTSSAASNTMLHFFLGGPNGTSIIDYSTVPPTNNTDTKSALNFVQKSTAQGATNGVFATNISKTPGTKGTINQLSFGQRYKGTTATNGYIQRFSYYPVHAAVLGAAQIGGIRKL